MDICPLVHLVTGATSTPYARMVRCCVRDQTVKQVAICRQQRDHQGVRAEEVWRGVQDDGTQAHARSGTTSFGLPAVTGRVLINS